MKFAFEIPYSHNEELTHLAVNQRLDALKIFNDKFKKYVSPFPIEEMLDALASNQKLPTKLTNEKSPFHINDFDIAELFIAYTFYNEAQYPDDFILMFDNDLPMFTENEDHVIALRRTFRFLGESLRQFNYPRIRAKLIYWELVTLINKDEKFLMDLITFCPEYLGSSYLKLRVHDSRFVVKHIDREDAFFNQLGRAIKGDLRAKLRKYNYWEIDNFYCELTEGIKAYNQIKNEESFKDDFLRDILADWELSREIYDLIISEPKKYSQHAISALIEKKLIPDATTYTHTIQPYLKIIKENIKYINACSPQVRAILDAPFRHPEYFERVYVWSDISSYDFDELHDFQPEKCLIRVGCISNP